jgi:DNA-binding response OmpR family regulator
MVKILVVEDEESILLGLTDNLQMEGFEVVTATNGVRGLEEGTTNSYDLIILDLMLPLMDGFEVCKRLRHNGTATPVLMLTAKSTEVDKVLGLELGADDYVTKPFSPRELLARIKAILRRSHPQETDQSVHRFGEVIVDFRSYEATRAGRPMHLTALEFNLLRLFLNHQGVVLSREEILDGIWGKALYVTSKTVDTHVAHLRQKIEADPSHPEFLIGVRGVGYKFVPEPVTHAPSQ